jgi:hypothetical protein
MAQTHVLANWSHFLDGATYSAQAFYESLEEALRRREIPDVGVSRLLTAQGGFLGGKREYVRVERKQLVFDICAAPFGNGFFVSWWCGRAGRIIVVLLILLLAALTAGFLVYRFGAIGGLVSFVAIPFELFLIGALVSKGVIPIEDDVRGTPLVGWIYDLVFQPVTYYSLDTARMFQAAVHVAVLEVMDTITEAGGLRALSELERKPTLREMQR